LCVRVTHKRYTNSSVKLRCEHTTVTMSSSPEEPDTSATRLEWSADDDNDFFSKESSDGDGDWDDDGFDADKGVDVSPEEDKEADYDDSNAPGPDDVGLLEDDDPGPDDPGLLEDTTMDATDNERESVTGDFSSLNAGPAPTRSAPFSNSNPAPSGGRPPPSGSKIAQQFKQRQTSSKAMADTPNILSSVSGSTDSGTDSVPATPLSLAGTTTPMPLVELEDEDKNFEEIVRKRNRVSQNTYSFELDSRNRSNYMQETFSRYYWCPIETYSDSSASISIHT
jgi:hypothetical protein